MLTIISFFIVLSILVLIHEFGHFIMAKKSGMLVEEFGLGLPPRIYGIKFGETLYSINWLPFGGFVKIFGETPEDYKSSPLIKNKELKQSLIKRAFNNKPWYQRAIVLLAGPAMNFILAVVVISYMFTRGVYMPVDKVTVVGTVKGSPAKLAGLKPKDIITTFADKEIITTDDLMTASKKYAGKPVELKYERDGNIYKVNLIPRKNPPKNQGALGVTITDLEKKKYPFYQSPFIGLKESLRISGQFYKELGKIVVKMVTFQKQDLAVSGPVGIAKLSGQAAEQGFEALFQLLGILSLNLALLNILPFPALDGGQLTFVLYEALTKRKISEVFKAKVNTIGFAILLFLLFLVTLKDIRALF